MTSSDCTVAIIGTGNIGSILATNFAAGGQDFLLASRDQEAARKIASGLGAHAEAVSVDEAVDRADVLVLAVWLDAFEQLVAQYGDACNLFGGPETVAAKLAVLKQHCANLGRDYGSIEKTSLSTVELRPGKMTAADVLALCRALAAVGVQHAIFNLPNVHDITPLEVFGREIIPLAAAL